MKTLLIDAVSTLIIKDEGPNQEMIQMLNMFDNPKIVVTNANEEEMKKFGIDSLPYEVFTLHHEPDKTDPEYFLRLFVAKNFSKDDVLYVENNIDAVNAALSIGIASYRYDPEKKDVQAVKKFLDENI
ncbi:MAG: hypothetical protein WCT28_00885 [Patescibacteria group bacterium]|jgi:FMN phosphatase YigB (HAD superfamily)